MVTVAGGDLKSFNPNFQIDAFAWEAQNAIYSMRSRSTGTTTSSATWRSWGRPR